jgi:hypothetical protein
MLEGLRSIRPLPLIAAVVAVIFVLALLIVLARIEGELHQRNCFSKVQLTYPPPSERAGNSFLPGSAAAAKDAGKRAKAVASCSSSPF